MTITNEKNGQSAHSSNPNTGFFASGRLQSWRTIDLITAAMLAVAFGVAFWGFDTLIYPQLTLLSAGFPPLGELALGVWLLPAVVGALVIRRPGAALFVEIVAANIELLLGNSWGAGVLLSALLQAIGVEIVFALFRWKRFGVAVAILAGMLSALIEIAGYEWWAYVPAYSPLWKAIYLLCGIVSGGVIAGFGGWALTRALARTGALKAFPIGQEFRESRRVR